MFQVPGLAGGFSLTRGFKILSVLHLAGLLVMFLSGAAQDILGLVPAKVVGGFAFWQLGTHSFLHLNVGSLIGVLFILLFFAVRLEREWGLTRFLVFYFAISAITGFLRMLPELGSTTPLVGTLGVMSGIFAAYAETFRHERASFFGFSVKVRVLAYAFIALAAVSSYRQPMNLLWFTGVPAGIILQRLMVGRSWIPARKEPKPSNRFSSLDLEE